MVKCYFSFSALPLPVIVRTICLFDNFEKLSTLLEFSRNILEGWARICCVQVFLLVVAMVAVLVFVAVVVVVNDDDDDASAVFAIFN